MKVIFHGYFIFTSFIYTEKRKHEGMEIDREYHEYQRLLAAHTSSLRRYFRVMGLAS
jgi:hypothetical protein